MASIVKATTENGQVRWRARYRSPDGTSREKWFTRKVDAEQFLVATEHRKLAGEYVDPHAGRVTLRDYAQRWLDVQVHRPTTAAQLETNLRRHVLPQLGDRAIGSIRPSEVQAWVKQLSATLAPSTVELIYRYLASMFLAAVEDRVVSSSPCSRKIKLPKREARQVQPLGIDQVRRLVDAMPERYRALVVLGAGSGLRQGEAFGLTVDRVDFLRRTVKVDRQMVLLPGGGPQFGPPKTASSHRTVPVSELVIVALSAHLAAFGEGPDRLIFTNDGGQPIRRTRFSEVWRPAAAEAGIPSGTGFHALRHFFASLLIAEGCSVKVVQSALGHATAAETLDTYSHLWPDDDDRARSAVQGALAAVGLVWGSEASQG